MRGTGRGRGQAELMTRDGEMRIAGKFWYCARGSSNLGVGVGGGVGHLPWGALKNDAPGMKTRGLL